MHEIGTGRARGIARLAAGFAFALVVPALLTACASNGGGDALKKPFGAFFANKDLGPEKPADYSPEYFTQSTYCPPVRVRSGTEQLVVYERGHDMEPGFVRHLASIRETARECRRTPQGLAIKLGVAGRLVAGPKGAPGSVSLPLRVVVTQESGTVHFSELYNVPVTLVPPDLSAPFSQVIEQIVVPAGPEDRDFIVYVGFDEGKPS